MKQSALLKSVNMQLSASVQWQPLAHSGTTNQLYTGRYCNQDTVLRLNAEQPVLGVCRVREEKVLKRVSGQMWAPTILRQQMPDKNQAGWLLMSRYTPLNEAPIANLQAQILACICAWQQIQDLPLFDYSALWSAYQKKIDELENSSQAQMLLDSIRARMFELGGIARLEACLVHHDLHKGNLLSNKGQLIIIDWEYAGLGNPWLDAAALLTEFSIPHQAIAALPAFRQIDFKTFQHGINLAQQINQQLNQLWYALNTHVAKN